MTDRESDVVVVGAGNAAMCAALAAREQGADVLMAEAAPEGPRAEGTAATPRARCGWCSTVSRISSG